MIWFASTTAGAAAVVVTHSSNRQLRYFKNRSAQLLPSESMSYAYSESLLK